MKLLSYGPEPYASANSAISAYLDVCLQTTYYIISRQKRKVNHFFNFFIYLKQGGSWSYIEEKREQLLPYYKIDKTRFLFFSGIFLSLN